MIDHAYHMPVSSTYLRDAEVSDTDGPIFDAEGQETSDDEVYIMEVINWNEEVELSQQEDLNAWDGALVAENGDEDVSSGGEWSVNVLRRNRDWNDTESEESEQSEHITGNDSAAMVEVDWNVEVLDTETDWNEDIACCDPVSEAAPSPASNDWNVEVLEQPVEYDWSTDLDDTDDERTFQCSLCEKQYLNKSSLTKHMFLVHNKRLSPCRNSYIS
ncbi:uncharacterized protein LOC126560924 [Anopheles maculipalpis]|uniref:uncharacterized protein LOC126560924 n=1 Tax=Anopheles maculipalpis TaxID=1496333 RepID=UPI002159A1F3|nr:uncharacterized protein LOC126560924 [Anopheles maculipalpis]